VRSGESLWTIARYYGVKVTQLVQWNGLTSKSVLHVGQKLTIRPRRARVINTAYETGPGPQDTQRTVVYTVREGDSLYSISSRFRVSVADIASWNGISEQHYLHAGERLKLYVDVADQSSSG
ncbi:MAG: LysM peptidoglycan-binding domain-containing protein, partial [Gammaproteobacteria bacterium]